jgi:hypothetical protein
VCVCVCVCVCGTWPRKLQKINYTCVETDCPSKLPWQLTNYTVHLILSEQLRSLRLLRAEHVVTAGKHEIHENTG